MVYIVCEQYNHGTYSSIPALWLQLIYKVLLYRSHGTCCRAPSTQPYDLQQGIGNIDIANVIGSLQYAMHDI